jgi:hypothetical protein
VDVSLLLEDATCHEYTPFNFLGINESDVKRAKDVLWAISKLAQLVP